MPILSLPKFNKRRQINILRYTLFRNVTKCNQNVTAETLGAVTFKQKSYKVTLFSNNYKYKLKSFCLIVTLQQKTNEVFVRKNRYIKM